MRKHIPNILTLANLFSGCIAIVMAFQGHFGLTTMFVIAAALFDFLDGFAARILNAPSDIGKELDSLADVVSFGVAPASAVFVLLRDFAAFPFYADAARVLIPYLAYFIPAFSALRLAKFNIDDRQTTSFLGLPTPANGLFWVSYVFGVYGIAQTNQIVFYFTIGFIFVLSLLMVSEIPMFSLKVKRFSFKETGRQALVTVLTIAFIVIWGVLGIAWGVLAYIVVSIFTRKNEHEKSLNVTK